MFDINDFLEDDFIYYKNGTKKKNPVEKTGIR